MKKALLVLTALFVFSLTQNVYATSLSFSGESSAEQGVEYKLSLVYSGQDQLGTAEITFEYENAECTIYSPVATSISSEKISVMTDDPIKSNTAIAILTCKSTQAGSASIMVRSEDMTNGNGDAKLAEPGVPIIGERQMTITESAGYVPPEPTPTPVPTDNPNPTPTPESTDDPTRTQTPPDDTLKKELAIKSLEIVGYPITFSNDLDEYQIEVMEGVTDIYVVADTEVPDASFERLGKINIDGLDSVKVKLSNDSKTREVTIYIRRIPKNGSTAAAPVTTTSKSSGMDILKIASLGLNVLLVAGGVYFYMQNKKTAKEGAAKESGEATTEESKTEEKSNTNETKQEVVKNTVQPQVAKQETATAQPQTAASAEVKPQQVTTTQVTTTQASSPQVVESIADKPATTKPVKKKVVINTSSIIKD